MRNIFTHWESVINFTRNDIVFENKNKQYGAYAIRKYYPERLRNAFLYVTSAVTLLLVVPLLLYKSPEIKIPLNMGGDFILYKAPVTEKPFTGSKQEPVKSTKRETNNIKVAEETKEPDVSDPTENPVSENNTDSGADPSDNPSDNATKGGGTVIAPPDPDPVPIAPVMPEFVGGQAMLEAFLKANTVYPVIARQEGISGRVYVTFVVDKEGRVKNAVIRRGGFGGGLEEEALRVVRLMPDWEPGRDNFGKPIAVLLTLPINFVLH